MMQFDDNSFDMTIDKGTLDALMVKKKFSNKNKFNSAQMTMKFPKK